MRDAQLEAVEELIDVEGALAKLTKRQREVLALAMLGWTQEEIAQRLGICQQVVGEHLAKAREILE